MDNRKSRISKIRSAGLLTALAVTMAAPQAVFADVDDLKQQQNQQQQQLDSAREKEKAAREKKDQFQKEITVNATEINKLVDQIHDKEGQISQLQGQIFEKNQQIDKTQAELNEAIQRVKDRDEILKKRLTMMYERGEVQYLEVLLNSTSFSDFLDRFDTLQVIFEQDKKILEKNKQDRDKIDAAKKELETQKTSLVTMKAQQQDQKAELDGMKAQKVVLNQKLEANKSEQERIEHEQQKVQDNAVNAIYNLQKQIESEQYKQNTTPKQQFTGAWGWPVPSSNIITSEFGERVDPFTGERAGHNGMDIAAPEGTTVVAVQSGTVITAGWVTGFGNCIIIDHGGNLWSLYGHLTNGGILVAQGQQVKRGDVIGKVGTTGRSTGPHLHLGAYLKGQVVNPRNYL
jgi:murein DD-endopeptidase MepM/ murein hydrolase activator NlpD